MTELDELKPMLEISSKNKRYITIYTTKLILIRTKHCPKCTKLRNRISGATNILLTEIELNDSNISEIMTKLRTSGIFKTEMPILVKEIGDEWEEVKCE